MQAKIKDLKFVFDEHSDERFLHRVEIYSGNEKWESIDEWESSAEQYQKQIRGVCIFLILAKHRYELLKTTVHFTTSPNKLKTFSIKFDDKAKRDQLEKAGDICWLKSASVFRADTGMDFIDGSGVRLMVKLFERPFVFDAHPRNAGNWKNGGKVGKTYATLNRMYLDPDDFEIHYQSKADPKKTNTLTVSQMADLAAGLEKFEVDKWENAPSPKAVRFPRISGQGAENLRKKSRYVHEYKEDLRC